MTTTDHRTLTAFEDAEQAHALSWPPVTLYYDDALRILRGPKRGRPLEELRWPLIFERRLAGWDVSERRITLRPWWRLWRPTRAIRITVRAMAGGFEQDFDDGGSADD